MSFQFDLQKANSNWQSWKSYLGKAVEFAEELGISKERINKLAFHAGELLAENIPPSNPEQKVMKELWEGATQEEKEVIARLMTKISKESQ